MTNKIAQQTATSEFLDRQPPADVQAEIAVVGSILGFTAYLTLVARIGWAKAAYATVLYPIVALAISTLFEGYHWHWTGALGLALALAGNLVMFARPRTGAGPKALRTG